MTNTRTLFILLPLLLLACSLTVPHAASNAMPLPEQTIPVSPTRTPQRAPNQTPARRVCQVKTGIEAGALNLRTCGGMDCPVLVILHEGGSLAMTQPKAIDSWLAVQPAAGLSGWASSKYLDCPA